LNADTEKLIGKVLRRNRNLRVGLNSLIGIVCLVLLFASGQANSGWWSFPGLLLAAGAVWCTGLVGLDLLRQDARRDDLLSLLTKSPEQIVWVYYYKVETMPFGIRVKQMITLYFWQMDRKHSEIRLSEREALQIMNGLRSHLPWATFGYSPEKEQLYRANPAMLRR
jgi:hypothetical protein